jgi:DNA-directed RNA polymerase alpha subunit
VILYHWMQSLAQFQELDTLYQNTRVGQMTNLDKLNITVQTDGTITPADAFEEASAILKNQYEALAGKTT